MRLLCTCLLAALNLAAQTRVEGVIVSSPANTPIAGVTVELRTDTKPAYKATTDSQGGFQIDGVTPGTYTADFNKPGFRQPALDTPARRPFQVAPGSTDIHLDAGMIPLGKISGTVLGLDRHPVAGASVQLFTAGNFVGQTGTTDKKGNFSFENIDPGTYVLSALAPKGPPPPPAEDGRKLAWARTYYPSSPYPGDALKFPIPAGAELFGRDIQLQALQARAVRGWVLTESGGPAPGLTVTAAPTNEIFARDVEMQAVSGADGSFEFSGLHDGDWRLSAQTGQLRTSVAQTINGGDIDKLNLRLNAAFTVTGRIVYDGQLSEGGIVLAPLEGGGNIPTAPWKADGTFQIANVAGGTYKINALSGPAHAYLASIQLGDREVMGQYVEIRSVAQPITITYRSDGGIMSGSVEDCGKAVIVVVPQDAQLRSSEFFRQTVCKSTDHFDLANVRPGEYYAWAFDKPPGMLEGALFAEQSILNQAVRVSVTARQSTNVALKVTHRE